MWCVAEVDAEYIARMEDVLALYEKPYNPREPVVCLDEKPVVLHAEVRPGQPAHFGLQKAVALWSRFAIHRTPQHGSWLNQAEVEISLFSRQCLGTRRIPNLATLRAEAKAWNQRINRDRVIVRWNFSRTDAQAVFHYQANLFRRSEC